MKNNLGHKMKHWGNSSEKVQYVNFILKLRLKYKYIKERVRNRFNKLFLVGILRKVFSLDVL